jgi:hypothetical protein
METKGIFFVLIPGIGHSYFFNIADNVNRSAASPALKIIITNALLFCFKKNMPAKGTVMQVG